jgi:Protein of unknown function (DUF2510)
MEASAPQPGWYPDPGGAPNWRYWDGTQWTDETKSYFRSIRELTGETLVLHRGGLNPKAEDLMHGEEVVVRLSWGGLVNRMQGDLTVESGEAAWRIDQQGLLPPRHVFFDHSGQIGVMTWQLTAGTGTLTLEDGRQFVWKDEWIRRDRNRYSPKHQSQWWLWESGGRAVVGGAHDGDTTTVQLLPGTADVPELPLFAGLAAYLVLRWLDSLASRDRRRRDF